MKPCKGCCHFRTTLLEHKCDYYVVEEVGIDPLSLEKTRKIMGAARAFDMRSETGECGPDRKLYDTYTKQFRRWIKSKFSKDGE